MHEDLEYNQINGANNCIMHTEEKTSKQEKKKNYNDTKVITQFRLEWQQNLHLIKKLVVEGVNVSVDYSKIAVCKWEHGILKGPFLWLYEQE